MNSLEISNLLNNNAATKHIFKGTYPCDILPERKDIEKPAAFIINTQPSTQEGEHWLVVYFPSRGLPEYFDSYGLKMQLKEIKDFIGQRYKSNVRLLQHLLSSACGQYCIHFIHKRCRDNSFESIIHSFSENQLLNDQRVNYYVENIFSTKLKIFHPSFMYKQISRALKYTDYWNSNKKS